MTLCIKFIPKVYLRFSHTELMAFPVYLISANISKPSVVTVISSRKKWLTSSLIFQPSCPVRTLETPLAPCLGPLWFNSAGPLNGGSRRGCVSPGQGKDPSLSSPDHSAPGKGEGRNPVQWCSSAASAWERIPAQSRRKTGWANILFCSSI